MEQLVVGTGPTHHAEWSYSNIAGKGGEGKDCSFKTLVRGAKSWNTNGLGVWVVAGRNLQFVIFAGPRTY